MTTGIPQAAPGAAVKPPIGTPLVALTIGLCFVVGVLGGVISFLGLMSFMGTDGCSTRPDPRACEEAVNTGASIIAFGSPLIAVAAIVAAIIGLSRRNRRAWVYPALAIPLVIAMVFLGSIVYQLRLG